MHGLSESPFLIQRAYNIFTVTAYACAISSPCVFIGAQQGYYRMYNGV